MGGTIPWEKVKKRKRKKKYYNAKSEMCNGASHQPPVLSVVTYNAEFARIQKQLYYHTCVVCQKQGYFMEACRRCQLAKYCSRGCIRKHCKQDDQCGRNVSFNNARERIPPDVKKEIFHSGIIEISPHIYSIPRREVYELMGGPRSVILLQVVSAQPFNTHLELKVQDVDGIYTVLNFHPNWAMFLLFFDPLPWYQHVINWIPPKTFILLRNCFWNNHADMHSAAVDISDLSCITPLGNTQ